MKPLFLSDVDKELFRNKRVMLRIDADVDLRQEKDKLVVDEDFRLKSVLPTIHFLQDAQVKQIILIGHLGRPEGKIVPQLSLKPVADWFAQQLGSCSLVNWEQLDNLSSGPIILLENLRFQPGEENNDPAFARQLARLADVYVNDAFAVAHRQHASVFGIPQFLPSFLGLRFEGEMRTLTWIKNSAGRPLVFVLGGSKTGKVDYISFLVDWADYLLIGGKLPLLIKSQKLEVKSQSYKAKLKIGQLKRNSKDITYETIEEFKKVIAQAETIIWAGPMGVYEEKENQRGTFEIAQAIAEAGAFKVAGGGDTHRVLSWLDLWDKFDFVSVGGGAMLQFLRNQTLPAIDFINR